MAHEGTPRRAVVALSVVLVAVLLWFLAGVIDDGLYALAGLLAVPGAVLGWRALREIPSGQPGRKHAMAATIVGGILSLAFVVSLVIFAITGEG